MRPRREATNSPQLCADVKNEWNFHSNPTTNISGVQADSFTLNSTLQADSFTLNSTLQADSFTLNSTLRLKDRNYSV
jgi:hypothetical protein